MKIFIRIRHLALFLVLTQILSGCTLWHPRSGKGESSELKVPLSDRTYYDYPESNLDFSVVQEEEKRKYVLKVVEFPLILPDELEAFDRQALEAEVEGLISANPKRARDLKLRYTNRIAYYVPKGLKENEKRPAIMISPILGGNMVVDRFAAFYAKRGFVVALVHRKRAFWDENRKDMQQVEDYLRTSIIRLRQALDWMEIQSEPDTDNIGTFAVSYGAILHSVLAAFEPRVKYSVLAMPAGPISEVIMHCPEGSIKRLVKKAQEIHGWSREEIRRDLESVIQTDPLLVAESIPRGRTEVYVALFDRVVGANRSLRLWKAMGKPKLRVLPFGHYGGILVFPYLQWQSYRSFKKHLSRE